MLDLLAFQVLFNFFDILQRSMVNLTSVPVEYMEPIIDFLYSSDTQLIKSQSSIRTTICII